MLLVAASCLLPMSSAALAQSKPVAIRNIDDCERINEAMAYNACLANFGPARNGGHMVTSEVSGEGDGKPAASTRRSGRSHSYKRHRGASASASFSIPSEMISADRRRR